jgi:hypothetical protein
MNFTHERLRTRNMPAVLVDELVKMAKRVKCCSKRGDRSIWKTDLFTHYHYNTLYLKLTPESIKEMQVDDKDCFMHMFVYKIDLREPMTLMDPA